jgi:ketosteroid isomerase-like protein
MSTIYPGTTEPSGSAPSVQDMSAEENKKFVREIFHQLAQGNGMAFTDAMADDMRWVSKGNSAWSGTWNSKAELLNGALLPLLAQLVGDYRSEFDGILADGDQVVVQSRGKGTTKRGEVYDQHYCYVFRVADRRITEVIEYCDTAMAERVLDPPLSKS